VKPPQAADLLLREIGQYTRAERASKK
jgi:hypothetical protein